MKVKKEITIAVIIGLIIGTIVVGGVLRARQALSSLTPTTTSAPSPMPSGTAVETQGLFLTIDTPDNQVTDQASLIISGKTLPATYIVINGEAGDAILVPNDLGNFSQEVKLVKGANTIKITVYQEDGTKEERVLNTVYTTAEI